MRSGVASVRRICRHQAARRASKLAKPFLQQGLPPPAFRQRLLRLAQLLLQGVLLLIKLLALQLPALVLLLAVFQLGQQLLALAVQGGELGRQAQFAFLHIFPQLVLAELPLLTRFAQAGAFGFDLSVQMHAQTVQPLVRQRFALFGFLFGAGQRRIQALLRQRFLFGQRVAMALQPFGLTALAVFLLGLQGLALLAQRLGLCLGAGQRLLQPTLALQDSLVAELQLMQLLFEFGLALFGLPAS